MDVDEMSLENLKIIKLSGNYIINFLDYNKNMISLK